MIEDFAVRTDQRARFRADICIIGAGVAGITVARQLLHSGFQICLLESGGADYEREVQDLAAGRSEGFPYYDLAESRLRFFGGSTAVWGGRVAQLDDIDFQARDWVPFSGWPFGKDELRPHYRQAQALLDLPPVENNALPGFASPFGENILQPVFWQFDEAFDRFTLSRCRDLERSDHVRILLHATTVEMRANDSGRAIEAVQIANLKGGRGSVEARVFVLATGGIEIPRLLLASRCNAHPDGIGNRHDLVGRFFMEHPRARGARIIPTDARRLFRLLPRFARLDGERYGMLFRPADALQRQEGLLNTGFTVAVRKREGEKQLVYKRLYNQLRHEISPTRVGRGLWKLTRRASIFLQDKLGSFSDERKLSRKDYGIYAVLRAEQAPNPESRVTLGDERDALNLPKPCLDWRFSDIDKHSAKVAMQALGKELQRLGLGHAEPADWLGDSGKVWEVDPLVSNHAIGGYHHMGTARMASDPKRGVVNADSRVHDVENLYVAGSAVFPTVGWANPNLTILALAIRLAEKLRATRWSNPG